MIRLSPWYAVVIVASVALTGCATKSDGEGSTEKWGYTGSIGPENWGKLSASFAACSQGTEQSPIDIVSGAAVSGPSTPRIMYQSSESTVTNDGHTVWASATGPNVVSDDGKTYDLIDMHFHSESEHTLDGVSEPLELHFMNKSSDGSMVAVAVFARVGADNWAAQSFVDASNGGEGETTSKSTTINWAHLLPTVQDSYVYQGSLTTPPCTEGVKWVVLRTPIEFSAEQMDTLQKAFKGNNRPSQPVGSREIIQWS